MSNDRIRLFVALELPSRTRSALAEWCESAVDEPSIRHVDPAALHVTLCFLGWSDANQLPQIAAACDLVSSEPAVELHLTEALWLPRRRPRVLAVALDDRDQRLALIQRVLAQRLQAGAWYVPERRPFLAHVTLARVRRGAKPATGRLPKLPRLSATGERITLFRSNLHPSGARYEPLHTINLAG